MNAGDGGNLLVIRKLAVGFSVCFYPVIHKRYFLCLEFIFVQYSVARFLEIFKGAGKI